MKNSTLLSRIINRAILLFALVLNNAISFSQSIEAPGREWYKSYWPDENLCDDESNQIESGEDWFFDVSLSKDIGGTNLVNGLICTGYQVKQTNMLAPLTCQLSSSFDPYYYCELRDQVRNVEPGFYRRGTVWFVDLDGHEKWYIDVGEEFEILEGRKIIQTYDGNYIMVGDGYVIDPVGTYSDHIPYNPGVSTTYLSNGIGRVNGIVAKISATTHEVLWINAYGLNDDFDSNLEGVFLDVVEDPGTHNLIIAGRSEKYLNPPATDKRTNAVIFNLDEHGQILWKSAITSEETTFSEFNCLKLVLNGTDKYITACGAEAPQGNNYTDRSHGTRSYLANFEYTSSSPGTINYAWYGNATGSKVNFIYDFEYLANGKLIIPSIEDCTACPYYAGKPQHTRIYDINPATFSVISTTDLGALAAYDMQSGIDATSDGGFVFLSTKQVLPPSNITTPVQMDDLANVTFSNAYPPIAPSLPTSGIGMNDCPNWFWYTNAYIAKFDENVNLEWENTYPFTRYDNSVVNRGDITAHECLYEIVQLPDGSFVACGNNSANFDDHILLKIHDDCENRLDGSYYIGNGFTSSNYIQHITSDITWNTDRKIRGTVIIDDHVTLTIENATIEFADTRKTNIPTTLIVEKGGKLIIRDNAKLTAIGSPCTGGVWDGIQIYGDPLLGQTPSSNQGYCRVENSTIEHARVGVRLSASYYEPGNYWYTPHYSKTGGIIETDQAHFIDNWKNVEFMKYNSPGGDANISHFDKTEFKFTGGFPNTSYFINNTGEYSGYKDFVSLWDVQGVKFSGCSFENTSSDITQHRGTGITSINATYIVDKYTELVSGVPVHTYSNFTNLYRGVQAFMYSATNGPTLNISNSLFENVRQGIGLSGFTLPYPVISNNTITLQTAGSPFYDPAAAWGIHATGCDYYFIQENSITSNIDPELPQRNVVGIAVNNRHDYNTLVYKNNIEKMLTGILPFGWNGTEGDDDGLLLKCNVQHDNIENDMKVVNDGSVVGSIKDNQGGCTSFIYDDYLTPSGNTFTDITSNPSLIHLNTTINASPYKYYYRAPYSNETPVTFTNTVTPLGCFITYLDEDLCPTKIILDHDDWHDGGWNWSEKIEETVSVAGKEAMEKLYFNYLLNSNQTQDIITYLQGKSPKSRHDSLTIYGAFMALQQYDSALVILNAITPADGNVILLQKLTQAIKADSIRYNFSTPFTDSLISLVLDSTHIESLFAENVLRLSDQHYFPFRIPENDSGNNKSSLSIMSETKESIRQNYISVYPNPNTGNFTISFIRESMENMQSFCIYDALGRKIISLNTVPNTFLYPITLNQVAGIYLLRIYSKDGKEDSSKIISVKE